MKTLSALLLATGFVIAGSGAAYAAATDTFRITKPLAADGTVSVCNTNGNVTIVGWDRSEVELVADKEASNEKGLAEIEIRVTSSPKRFVVETHLPERSWWSWGKNQEVRYQLRVPRSARIDQVETVNGSVELQDLSGAVRAETVNGSIRAQEIAAGARLETVNGSIKVGFRTLPDDGKLDFETVNGSIVLGLPSAANAELTAETVNGSIRNEFGLPVSKEPHATDFRGTLGSGGPRLSASTVNGSIRFVKHTLSEDVEK